MRVNVYDHELTDRVEVAKATADNTGQSFYGVRIYVGPVIMHQPGDDDSSAVTWWVPWSQRGGHDLRLLKSAFQKALASLAQIEAEIRLDSANKARAELDAEIAMTPSIDAHGNELAPEIVENPRRHADGSWRP
jgi:hypothetical protein